MVRIDPEHSVRDNGLTLNSDSIKKRLCTVGIGVAESSNVLQARYVRDYRLERWAACKTSAGLDEILAARDALPLDIWSRWSVINR